MATVYRTSEWIQTTQFYDMHKNIYYQVFVVRVNTGHTEKKKTSLVMATRYTYRQHFSSLLFLYLYRSCLFASHSAYLLTKRMSGAHTERETKQCTSNNNNNDNSNNTNFQLTAYCWTHTHLGAYWKFIGQFIAAYSFSSHFAFFKLDNWFNLFLTRI